ncbi:MAG: restriction endonuclease, partial [Waterburya sp.]
YLGINLNDKVTKTICRLYVNSNKKIIGIIDTTGKEVKQSINNLEEIYLVNQNLKERVTYLSQTNSD